MKVLLTGLPGTGKTTLLQAIIPLIEDPFWVICGEIRNAEDQRVGFEARTSTGLTGLLAHKQDIQSAATIGDYKVDLTAIDTLLSQPIRENAKAGKFLIIDEIGRMQMLSPKFAEIIREVNFGNTDFIATIRYGDDWTREFTEQADVINVVLTPQNREEASVAVAAMAKSIPVVASLSKGQKQALLAMAQTYAKNGEMISLRKLYKNAIRYVTQHKVSPQGEGKFTVRGDHGTHIVEWHNPTWACDCDLFNGQGQFADSPGECSHIQAAKLFQATNA